MSTESFTHVCKQCHTPALMPVRRLRFVLLSIAKATLATAMVLLLGWIGIALTVAWIIIEGMKFRRCRHCGSYSLIPVTTPVGFKIMEDEGWRGQT
jgi:hypothetical protein